MTLKLIMLRMISAALLSPLSSDSAASEASRITSGFLNVFSN